MTAQQLKNSILQMAVQGKLVPQDPNDEPASVLLERIRAEKEQLIKEKKIKKEKNPSVIFRGADNLPYEKVGKNEPVCIADEVPFEIPDSWEWVRLGTIFNIEMGQSPAGSTVSSDKNGIEFHQGKVHFGEIFLQESGQYTTDPKKYAEQNSVLLCVRAPVGKVNITRRRICIGRGLCAILPLADMPLMFIYYLLEAYENIFVKQATGTTFIAITAETVKNQLIPLPPLAEQKRIVDKISELYFPLKKYGEVESATRLLNTKFPEQLKKSILQWAVQGKLVPQDPSDEPAEVLLQRIRVEKQRLVKEGKIKKDKHESIIFRRDNSHYEKLDGVERCIDDELPFEIPESWCWCRLKSIVNVVSARRVHQSDWRSEGVPFYRAREIGKLADTGFVDNELYISEALYTKLSSSGVPHGGDLMVTAVGTLGKTYIVKGDDRFYYKDASVICFENFSKVVPAYLKILMCSPYMEDQIKQNSSGTTVSTITIVKANEYLIPLPPLKEQKRISDQIDYLQQYINNL